MGGSNAKQYILYSNFNDAFNGKSKYLGSSWLKLIVH